MNELPSPRFLPTSELLDRVQRLLLAMFLAALLLGVLPLPSFVHVIVLLVLPLVALMSAISYGHSEQPAIIHRYARRLWDLRHDRATAVEAGEPAAEPVTEGLRRAWLLMGIFVTVFLVGLVLTGLSAGLSDRLYG